MQSWGFGLLGVSFPRTTSQFFWPYVTQKVNGFCVTARKSERPREHFPRPQPATHPLRSRGSRALPSTFPRSAILHSPRANDHRAGLGSQGRDSTISLSLDIALNPDFSQVESDDPQVTVNQRYAVQFPEKRASFIENNGFFVDAREPVLLPPVVKSSIPEYGARLTGKLGRWNLISRRRRSRAGPSARPHRSPLRQARGNRRATYAA